MQLADQAVAAAGCGVESVGAGTGCNQGSSSVVCRR